MTEKIPIAQQDHSLTTDEALHQTIDQISRKTMVSNGDSLADLAQQNKLLLVFVRHAGCTFCRETLIELKGKLSVLKQHEIIPVVIHLGTPTDGERMLSRAGLQGTLHVSNPGAELYRAYELKRGQLSQLFGLRVLWRGFVSAILRGYGFGTFVGDGFQLGGAFLVENGRIIKSFPAKDAADKVPFECILE